MLCSFYSPPWTRLSYLCRSTLQRSHLRLVFFRSTGKQKVNFFANNTSKHIWSYSVTCHSCRRGFLVFPTPEPLPRPNRSSLHRVEKGNIFVLDHRSKMDFENFRWTDVHLLYKMIAKRPQVFEIQEKMYTKGYQSI